ncbi:MAG: hypothetical protein NE330_02960 [Lentisphaeraceae bacterium]|nr:hypothetical protein [Lentisphaeraceae bacterium]
MDSELNKFLNSALDSSLSSYYRRTALGQIGRLRKTSELVSAVLRLLNDLDDESLQKDVIDLAIKFGITESVNFIIPIGVGNGKNARYALSALAKIGGPLAYTHLRGLADRPGFDLTKNAATRALHDLVSREPDLEKIELEQAPVEAQKVLSPIVPSTSTSERSTSVTEPPPLPIATPLETKSKSTELLHFQRELASKEKELAKVVQERDRLENQLVLAKQQISENRSTTLENENHKLRSELSQAKAVFKKKISEQKLELSDIKQQLLSGKNLQNPAQSLFKGCFTFIVIIVAIVFFFIVR